jgi:hypothetical protein
MSVDLHTFFWGRQDDYISKMSSDSFQGTYVCTRIMTLYDSPRGRNYVTFSNRDDARLNYGYTNLRFIGNPEQIESIELELGGLRADKIYPKVMHTLGTFPILNEHILPALNEHEFAISAIHSGDVEMVFDVVQITNPIADGDFKEFVFKSHQSTGVETIHSLGSNQIYMGFNHPIIKVTMFSNHPVSNVCMNLDEHQIKLVPIDETTNQYIFNDSVNFSQINRAYMCFETYDQTNCCIIAHSLHVIKINKNKIGIEFSK